MTVEVLDQARGNVLSLYYGNLTITFYRKPRQSDGQKVLIKVQSDASVIVLAPERSTDQDVIAAVKKRSRWIIKQQNEFKQLAEHYLPRKYISGETHYYLGRQYTLKVNESNNSSITLIKGQFLVHTNQNKVKKLLNNWYRAKAKEIFKKRFEIIVQQTLWVEKQPPIIVREMKSQWGNCSSSGRLTLNLHLIKAPRDCIDYVILHELCHLAEHNHSARFYRLMNQVMPNWESIKNKLDLMAFKLID